MAAIFNALYEIHPWAPVVWIGIFAIGVGAVTFYTAFNQHISLGAIYLRAKSGNKLAAAVLISYAVAVSLTVLVIGLALARLWH